MSVTALWTWKIKNIIMRILELVVAVLILPTGMSVGSHEEDARLWLQQYDLQASQIYRQVTLAEWTYSTDFTDQNEQLLMNALVMKASFERNAAVKVAEFDWVRFGSEDIKRQMKIISDIGVSAMPDISKYRRLHELVIQQKKIYNTAEVCFNEDRCMSLHPGLRRLYAESRNESDLRRAWQLWRDQTGSKMRGMYEELAVLQNEAVSYIGYPNMAEYWLSRYESSTFESELEDIRKQVRPLYGMLHTYVKHQLWHQYGRKLFPISGHIPAHLLGNMWAENWMNVIDVVKPYPGLQKIDITSSLRSETYTVRKMFEAAENFFVSLGFDRLSKSFWTNSVFTHPRGGSDCETPARYHYMNDVRIKMCAEVTMEDYLRIHRELGHIYYHLHSQGLPVSFRDGANIGLHDAVGGAISLSVQTPSYLHTLGLLKSLSFDVKNDINFLLDVALQTIAFMPFGYLVDKWRGSVFRGQILPSDYNAMWWKLRCEFQGVSPPVPRSESDFDPGSHYHVTGNEPYTRFFVGFILQFQFHKALCLVSNHTGPLHACNIYDSKEAGTRLRNMLQLGRSRPWPELLETLTGSRNLDVAPLLEYFRPLSNWLLQETSSYMQNQEWTDECRDNYNLPNTAAYVLRGNIVFLLWTYICILLIMNPVGV
ncbi:hypothetical protein ACJMK2_021936 [Sinanodonta woodiana]|uniref:Angiotensin-converting enzyme n=1 Tax=Sinanodonta woodiana TaxID=1069815 RepID=A0ABD3THN6_SINWO